jgi:hypothetical protein
MLTCSASLPPLPRRTQQVYSRRALSSTWREREVARGPWASRILDARVDHAIRTESVASVASMASQLAALVAARAAEPPMAAAAAAPVAGRGQHVYEAEERMHTLLKGKSYIDSATAASLELVADEMVWEVDRAFASMHADPSLRPIGSLKRAGSNSNNVPDAGAERV